MTSACLAASPFPGRFLLRSRQADTLGVGALNYRAAIAFAIMLASMPGGPARSDGVQEATAAYQRGDYPMALKLYRGLADEGEPVAFSILGLMYSNGQGTPKDYGEAARWYRRAAEQGIAVSQTSLAGLYFNGKGVPRDVGQAIYWYRQAAEQGDSSAQFSLASIYEEGHGVPVDHELAMSWFRRAAAQGNPSARFSLAGMYETGRGAPSDAVRAYLWYDLAASTGWKLAVKARDTLAKRMTASQIVEARQMHVACLESNFDRCE